MLKRSNEFKFMPTKTTSPFGLGINLGGIEIFSNEKARSFVKEELQNTIDAQLDSSNPAYGEFVFFEYETSKFPCRDEFLETINKADAFYKKNMRNSYDTYEREYERARKVLSGKKMRCLRYSDFTDDGLYDNETASSPRKNLLYIEGQSDKPAGSGGSKGIGKNAALGMSALRCIFVATKDKNDDPCCVGIAKWPSYQDGEILYDGSILFGSGDYKLKEITYKNFDKKWDRQQRCGLDKYVMGVDFVENDEVLYEQMTAYVLQDFYPAIYHGKLIVKVGNTIIDQNSIEDLMNTYSANQLLNPETIGQYKAISGKAEVIYLTCIEPNDVKISFYEHEGGQRVVAMVGYNGIRIYNAKRNFPSGVYFDAVVEFLGRPLTGRFKRVENTEHTQLKKDDFKNDPLLIKFFNLIMEAIVEKIKIIQDRNYTTSMDIEGVCDYLPAMYIQSKRNPSLGKEQITNMPKEKIKKNRKALIKKISDNVEKIDVNQSTNGKQTTSTDEYIKLPQNNFQTRARISNNSYTLAVTCNRDIKYGYIVVKISGEDDFTDSIEVSNAKVNGKPAQINAEKIFIENFQQAKSNVITFDAKDMDNFALKVDVYANNE